MIEKGIPVPPPRHGTSQSNAARTKYPWADMDIGDSFLVRDKSQNAMATTASYHAKKLGRNFRAANVEGGVRVWRVS